MRAKRMEKGADKIGEVEKSTWTVRTRAQKKIMKTMGLMSDEQDEMIPLCERKRPMPGDDDEDEIHKKIRRQVSKRKKKSKLEVENPSIPVYELPFKHFNIDSGEESEEELVRDCDRDEHYRGDYNYIINQNAITYTRVKEPIKVYYRRGYRHTGCVLYDLNYPVVPVTKLALQRYNDIEAYKVPVDGFHFTVRFQARLRAQCPIYFQAMIWKRIPVKGQVLVDVDFVHPLP